MNLRDLELTLADIETQLLYRKNEQLEAMLDSEDDDSDPVDEAHLASDGAKIVGPMAGGGRKGGPEAYAGYTVGQEGTIHLDGGGTKSPTTTQDALRAALKGGPGDMPPQTQAGKASAAQTYNRKNHDNQGDVDHSGFQSGA